ncbi:MAG: vgr related protein [Sphingomonadales bacterium]
MAAARNLTAGETALAVAVFGNALDVAAVQVRRAKYWALHPWWVTMAPDGHIWCHPRGFNWRADYAAEPLGWQAHFIHELVHCWQVQAGGHLALRRPPLARYGYRLVPGKPFRAYGIEQQACMVADAFLARARGQASPVAALLPFPGWG